MSTLGLVLRSISCQKHVQFAPAGYLITGANRQVCTDYVEIVE